MSVSKFEHYRNEVISALSGRLDAASIGAVLSTIDVLSSKYDVVDKCSAIVPADDMIRQLAVLYLSCSRQDGKSESTVKTYKQILLRFCDAMRGKALTDIGVMDIRRYLLEYQNTGVHISTVDHVRVVIGSFFAWMTKNEYLEKDPCVRIDKFKFQKRTRTRICNEDVARLRNACVTDRERVIVEVLVGSGLRVSELAGLKMTDINFRDGSMRVLGKGSKLRTSYLSAEAAVAIERYKRGCEDRGYLVTDAHGNGVTARTIERAIKTVSQRANVETDRPITPHVLRHTFASSLVEHGCPITSVQKLLGHSSIDTTVSVYTHVTDESIRMDFRTHSTM